MTNGWQYLFPLLVVAALVAGCASDGDDQRVLTDYEDVGADAAADADGSDAGDPDTGTDAALDAGDDADTGGDVEEDADAGNDDVCQPVGDGKIRRSEFQYDTGFSIPYEFAVDVAVDIDGQDDNGTTVWDFEDFDDDDFTEELELRDPADYWFGDEFPDADYAVDISVQADELGVYEVTDDALLLVGLATPHGPDDDDPHTHIEYDPPIEALSFPLEESKSWGGDVSADGDYAEVTGYTGHDESYEVEVDAAGELITPYGTFDVLRVYTVREHPTSDVFDPCWYNIYLSCDIESRVVSYVTECFGTVARVLSHEDEPDHSFDEAAEVMRLSQ